jgi:formylglycine-generating enzyme required for sulfatase activity
MTRDEAENLLNLPGSPSVGEVESAVIERRRRIEQRLDTASTEAVRDQCRRQLDRLEEAKTALLGETEMLTDPPSAQADDARVDDAAPRANPGLPVKPGQNLAGRYEIKEQIGAGGMGAVYRAFDRNREKDIAIKVLLPSMLAWPHVGQRLLLEGRLTSELSHPNIVTMFDVQRSGAHTFLTMELLKGRSLRAYLDALRGQGRKMRVDEALRIIEQVCQGLAYAHEKNVVHRDVKPGNVWLTEDGKAKVMDFGIARLLSNSPMTRSMMALGTPNYMAPEQLRGVPDIDGRADQYAVAVMLYEMLVGHPPNGPGKSLTQLRRDVPLAVSRAVDKASCLDPSQRYGDMNAFLHALKSDGIRWSAKAFAMIGGIAAGVAIATLVWLSYPRWKGVQPEQASTDDSGSGKAFRDCPECPEMVVIPAGKFLMGSPPGESGRSDEEGPQRVVAIGRSFALGRYEVTRGEYARFVSSTHHAVDTCTDRKRADFRNPGFKQTDQHPAVCVSLDDAETYARWLSTKTGQRYRLPTEAEWEYAARAGTDAARYWGNEDAAACLHANVADQSQRRAGWRGQFFSCFDGYKYTAPVGSFRPNPFGLYDMLGNVWEWSCSDYVERYDGTESSCGSGPRRVNRGGSWTFLPDYVRSATRNKDFTTSRYSNLGFRLARDLEPQRNGG